MCGRDRPRISVREPSMASDLDCSSGSQARAGAGRRHGGGGVPGSRGCCKQWIQDRETDHSTRWRSGEPPEAALLRRPSTPPRLLLAVGSEMRARIDWGLQRSAREPSRSSSPGRAGAGAARCAMAEGPGRGLRGSSARQPRRRIKPRTTEEFQTAGQLQSSCFGQVIRC